MSYHTAVLDYTSAKIEINYINETYIKLINEDKIVNTDDLSDFKNAYKGLEIRKERNNEYWRNEINELDEQIDLNLLCSQKSFPPHSLQCDLRLLCRHIWLPPHSLHLDLILLCSQISPPPHFLQRDFCLL